MHNFAYTPDGKRVMSEVLDDSKVKQLKANSFEVFFEESIARRLSEIFKEYLEELKKLN